jgi:predicted RNase H-like HicB family nuclease
MKKYFVNIEQDEDGMFIGSIPSVPSCHAEGRTKRELFKNLEEVLTLCLRNFEQTGS